MKIKVKKLDRRAVLPKYAKAGDAAMDLTAITEGWDLKLGIMVYGTGLAFEIPEGYVGLIFPRSSIYRTGQTLTNCVGVIDSGFRGEIKFIFRDGFETCTNYKVGDRIGQIMIMPYPKVEIEEVPELTQSERGEGGFGSSGR